MDILTTIGLLINEVVTNSVKHAFNDKTEGVIEIILSRVDCRKCELTISDNGSGTTLDTEDSSNSIGLTIIDALIEQLEGECVRESSTKGTTYHIAFNTLVEQLLI